MTTEQASVPRKLGRPKKDNICPFQIHRGRQAIGLFKTLTGSIELYRNKYHSYRYYVGILTAKQLVDLQLKPWVGNRPLKESHVEAIYKSLVQDDTEMTLPGMFSIFLVNNQPIGLCDGCHRYQALCRLPEAKQLRMGVIISCYDWFDNLVDIQEEQCLVFQKINYCLPYDIKEFKKHKEIKGIIEEASKCFTSPMYDLMAGIHQNNSSTKEYR
jgi:hypothetical protein